MKLAPGAAVFPQSWAGRRQRCAPAASEARRSAAHTRPARVPKHPKQKVSFMTRELVPHNRPVFDQLHPNIYKAAVVLVALFAVAAWILFDPQKVIALPLAIVSLFFLVAVSLPWSLSLVWQKHRVYPTDDRQP